MGHLATAREGETLGKRQVQDVSRDGCRMVYVLKQTCPPVPFMLWRDQTCFSCTSKHDPHAKCLDILDRSQNDLFEPSKYDSQRAHGGAVLTSHGCT